MKESKIIEEFQEEARLEKAREYILQVLDAKFGARALAEFTAVLKNPVGLSSLTRRD
jgi:hypothetical protein